MTLKELQEMIKEEFDAYMGEQEDDVDVSVSDADVDVDAEMGGEEEAAGEEDVLRVIYDLLAAHFEGGAGAGVAPAGGAPEEMGDMTDMDAGDDMDMEDPGMDDGDGDVDGADAAAKADDKDDDDAEALQERFKKLANIVKG